MRGAVDFETYEWIHPICCGLTWPGGEEFIHDKTHKNPDSVAEAALIFMDEHDEVEDWYAHNMGRYDGLFFCAAAIRLGWRIKGILAGGGRVIGLEFYKEKSFKRPVRLFDSFNLCARSLKECATAFELPSHKLFTADDYSIDTRKWKVSRLREGCLIDCKLILELLDKLETLTESWGGKLKYTFASTSMSIIKAHLAERGMEIPVLEPSLNEELAPGYYGARVEVFHHAPQHLICEYDINSAYPDAMAQALPWDYIGYLDNVGAIEKLLQSHPMMIEATVTIPSDMVLPPLPFLIPEAKDAGLFFPVGSWDGTFTSEELLYARELGCTVRVKEAHIFNWNTPLKEFVAHVYETKATAKKAGKIALANFAKDVLNAGYGKFGENPEHETLVVFGTEEEAIDYCVENASKVKTRNGDSGVRIIWEEDRRFVSVVNVSWSKHAHYAIAAFITSRARLNLHRYLVQSRNPAYCDSDSIHCQSWDGETSTKLGDLKLEREKVIGEYFAPKIYRLVSTVKHAKLNKRCKECCPKGKKHFPCGVKLACKGFPIGIEEFEQVISGEQVKTSRMRLLKSQMGKQAIKEHTTTQVQRLEVIKRWAGRSAKRKPSLDGSTRPWEVKELLDEEHEGVQSPIAKRAV